MSYTPNVWASNDVVTAQKMNHIETGIASIEPPMIIHNSTYDYENYCPGRIDGYADILTELQSGAEVYIIVYDSGEQIMFRYNIIAWMYQDMGYDSLVLTFIGIDNAGQEYWFPETDYNPDV